MATFRDPRQGARFIKTNGFDRGIWIVDAVLDLPGCPRHVRLAKEGVRGETLTLSAATLSDRNRFRALSGQQPS